MSAWRVAYVVARVVGIRLGSGCIRPLSVESPDREGGGLAQSCIARTELGS